MSHQPAKGRRGLEPCRLEAEGTVSVAVAGGSIRAALWVNTLAVAGSRALAGVGKALAMVVVARNLPVGEFGHLALVFAWLEVFRQVSDFGVGTVATRRIARAESGQVGQILGTLLAVKVVLAVAGGGGLLAVTGLFYGWLGAIPVAALAGGMVITWAVATGVAAYFQARLRMAEFAWAAVAGVLSTLVAVLTLVAAGGGGLVGFVGAFLVGDVVASLLGLVALRRSAPIRLTVSLAAARNLLRTAWPVALTQIFVIAYFRLDVVLLAWLIDVEQVGLYGVTFKITEPLLLVPAALAASLYGAASPLWGKGQDGAAVRLYGAVALAAVVYGLVVAGTLSVLAPRLLAWLVPQYQGAARALQILAWSLLFMALNMVTTAALNSLGRFSLVTAIAGATFAVCLVANLALIPALGILGASLATVLTEASNCALQLAALAWSLRRRVPAPVL